MFGENIKDLKFGSVTVLILLSIGYLAYTGVQESKRYYVTIKELRSMGETAYTKRKFNVTLNTLRAHSERESARAHFSGKCVP